MVEILQLLGSSSFMIIPSEADFANPLAPDIEQYLATDTATARDRVKLFRLAWDIAGSSLGSRQVLYERFFASDPLTRARVLNALFRKKKSSTVCSISSAAPTTNPVYERGGAGIQTSRTTSIVARWQRKGLYPKCSLGWTVGASGSPQFSAVRA